MKTIAAKIRQFDRDGKIHPVHTQDAETLINALRKTRWSQRKNGDWVGKLDEHGGIRWFFMGEKGLYEWYETNSFAWLYSYTDAGPAIAKIWEQILFN